MRSARRRRPRRIGAAAAAVGLAVGLLAAAPAGAGAAPHDPERDSAPVTSAPPSPSVDPASADPASAGAVLAPAAGPVYDTSSRAAIRAAYRNVLVPALAVPIGWSGSVAGCNPGTTSAAARTATLTAVNFYRGLVGVQPVTLDPALSSQAQAAALMMQAQGALSHSPGTGWACYSPAGAAAAARSNLALGVAGARAIAGYMVDPGSDNAVAGHRRWILDPRRATFGTGSTTSSNALYVLGATAGPAAGTPEWLAWPTPGHFPVQLDPADWSSGRSRWSLSARDGTTSFAAATVSVTREGTPLPVTVVSRTAAYGPNTIVFELAPGFPTGGRDRSYTVRVANIVRNGVPVTHQYTVRMFDAAIEADQTITFPTPADRRLVAGPFTLAASASSGLAVSFTSLTPTVCTTGGTNGARLTPRALGVCTVRAGQPGSARWNPAASQTRTFRVITRVEPLVGDWNGDGLDGIGTFDNNTRGWLLRNPLSAGGPQISFGFGGAGDMPVVGDWDGDGLDGIGVYRPSSREWLLRETAAAGGVEARFGFGGVGDIPVVGDWDGDGRDGIGVYRPSSREWLVRETAAAGGVEARFGFGGAGDIPVVGDWDGDGRDGIGVYRPSSREWLLRETATGGGVQRRFGFGGVGDRPVSGVWVAGGDEGIGVYRPASANWLLRDTASGGGVDHRFAYGPPE